MFAALPEIAEQKHFTLEMPNRANFAFNCYWAVILLTLTYILYFLNYMGEKIFKKF